MNKENRKKLTGTENELGVARWEGVGRLSEKDEGIKKYKLVVTK